ncbi:MAG: homoserine kinase [Peptococcaceae bacterium]|nr:homoserine kinase [Peptococcaceae bacterium]
MFSVRVPATSANIGPGFDCMGMALTLYNTFAAEPGDTLTIALSGAYTDAIPLSSNNLVWNSMRRFWRETGEPEQTVALVLHNMIPPTRGLGSSSTAVVGGLLLANALSGNPLSREELLRLACVIEGHPDNVTPAFLGGVTLTVQDKGPRIGGNPGSDRDSGPDSSDTILPRVLDPNPGFKVVVVIPDILVETEKARAILPPLLSREDLIFNASRVGLLVNAIMSRDYALLATATEDRAHQTYRAALVPGMSQALKAAVESGAYGAVLSGSGPALLAICPEKHTDDCAWVMREALLEAGLVSVSMVVDVDSLGAVISS